MPFTDEQKKTAYAYINEYNKNNYDRFNLLLEKGYKEKIKKYAQKSGKSVSQFITICVEKEIERMNKKEV